MKKSESKTEVDSRAQPPAGIAADNGVLVAEELVLDFSNSGRYEDRGLLGRGGMGEVRSLHDTVLYREVAAKLMDPELAKHHSHVERFVEEARITAQLDHPNIIPVHELEQTNVGTSYFTMKHVRGITLASLLEDVSLPLGSSERLSTCLEVFLKVCDAIAFAHSRGVLHRDLKPENIMVGAYGEVYVMDWGLAKILRDRTSMNVPRAANSPLWEMDDSVVGTPAFLSPEVANSDFDRVDERTDIFGLGAVLYQIVTGVPPYSGASIEEVMDRAKACSWVLPDEVGDSFVPLKLARVIARAMARDPAERYATVRDLATQVRQFLHRGHHLPTVRHPKGTLLLREGDPGDHAYLLTRGTCEVFRMEGGKRKVLRRIGPGSIFGESAILGPAPRMANVEATTDTTMLVLTREALQERLFSDSWEGLLAKTLIERFREADAQLAAMEREQEKK